MINKNNAPDAIEKLSKRMAVTAIESRDGGVNLVSALLVSEIRSVDKPGSKYGLSVG